MKFKAWVSKARRALEACGFEVEQVVTVSKTTLRTGDFKVEVLTSGQVNVVGDNAYTETAIAALRGDHLLDASGWAVRSAENHAPGVLIDRDIAALCCGQHPMISPYVDRLVREVDGQKVISYGQSSCGYDVRCVPEWLVFVKQKKGEPPIDPKRFDSSVLKSIEGSEYLLPPNSCVLTRTIESFIMPPDVVGQCVGKSTYARCGLVVNVTPLEPGWKGTLVMELSNTTGRELLVRAGEGIAQIVFHRLSDRPSTTYADRKGKYQDQQGIVTAKV